MLNSFRKLFAKLPNLRGKQRLQKVLDLNFGPIPVKAKRTAGRLLIYPSSVQDSYFWLASTDNNPDLVAAINSLPTNGVFVDIGANIGFYSLMAANRLTEQGTVLSFEPSDREYSRLFWAKQCNKYECIWITLNAAVGDSGVKRLDTESGHTGMNRISTDNDNRKGSSCISVRLKEALALFCLVRIDLLKIDIEGYELRALQTFQGLLKAGLVNTVICEITDRFLWEYGDCKQSLYAFMKEMGFAWRYGPLDARWQYDEVFTREKTFQ